MTFLLLLLSFFQVSSIKEKNPDAQGLVSNDGTETSVKGPYPMNELFILSDSAIHQLHSSNFSIQWMRETPILSDHPDAKWIYTNTEKGELIAAMENSIVPTVYEINAANEFNPIDLSSYVNTFGIKDLFVDDGIYKLLGVDFSSYNQVLVSISNEEIMVENLGSWGVGLYSSFYPGHYVINPVDQTKLTTERTVSDAQHQFTRFKLENFSEGFPVAVKDLAYDVYGELYGLIDNQLHYFDLDDFSFTRVWGPDVKINGIFSLINEPKSYGLGPKSQFIQNRANEDYHGEIKLTNRFDEPLTLTIEANQLLQDLSTSEEVIIAPGEVVYFRFSISSSNEIDFDEQVVFQMTVGENTWQDSVRVNGFFYEPQRVDSEEIYIYDPEVRRVHLATEIGSYTSSTLNSFNQLRGLTTNSIGEVFGLMGPNLVSVDVGSGDVRTIQDITSCQSPTCSFLRDLTFVNEQKFYAMQVSSGFRSDTKQLLRQGEIKDGEVSWSSLIEPTLGHVYQRIIKITYDKQKHSIYLLTNNDEQEQHLYEQNLMNGTTRIIVELDSSVYVRDLFFDGNDQLNAIVKQGDRVSMVHWDLNTMEFNTIQELGQGAAMGISRLSDYVLNTDDLLLQTTVFPNPTNSFLQIESNKKITQVQIFDLFGKEHSLSQPDEFDGRFVYFPGTAFRGVFIVDVKYEDGSSTKHRIVFQP